MLDNYKDILSADEVAEILGVSRRSVYTCIEAGAIRSFRLRTASGREMRRVFIPKQALIEYIEGAS